MREIVSLDVKVHLRSNHALFLLWEQFDLRWEQKPGHHQYVLVAECSRHAGAVCEVWAVVEPNEKGEPVCTLRLPTDSHSLIP
jgi:hypothetical protein